MHFINLPSSLFLITIDFCKPEMIQGLLVADKQEVLVADNLNNLLLGLIMFCSENFGILQKCIANESFAASSYT